MAYGYTADSNKLWARVAIVIAFAMMLVETVVIDNNLAIFAYDAGTHLGVFGCFSNGGAGSYSQVCAGPGCGPEDIATPLAFFRAWHAIAAVSLLFSMVVVLFKYNVDAKDPAKTLGNSVWPFFMVTTSLWLVLTALLSSFDTMLTARDRGHNAVILAGIAFDIVSFTFTFLAFLTVCGPSLLSWKGK